MWLVAPSIPGAIREFLDRIGIEYTEIHEAQFRRVAERHGVSIARDPSPEPVPGHGSARSMPRAPLEETGADAYRMLPDLDKEKLARLLQEFEAATKRRVDRSLAVKLRHEILEPAAPSISRSTMLQLARWCETAGAPYQDGMAVAQRISTVLFGLVLDRSRFGV